MKHLDLAFEERVLPLDTPEFSRDIGLTSPSKRVPILKHGALLVWDSLAICEYLAERHPEKRLWPADAAARAHARSVSAEMHSGFGNLRSQMPMNVRRRVAGRARTPEVLADIARIGAIWEECRGRFGATGPFLYGEFSIADAMYAPVVSRFHTYGVESAGAAAGYAQTILGLPAFRQWVAEANAEAEVVPQYEP